MMSIFAHTAREPGMWRGWLENGQSVELSWRKRGWTFGGGVHVHSNDEDQGSRMLFVQFWRFTAIIPLGIIRREISIDDQPQWSAYFSSEFGLTANWGQRRFSPDLPWDLDWYRTSKMLADRSWYHETRTDRIASNLSGLEMLRAEREAIDGKEWVREYPFTYILKSGEVQKRTATVKINEREWRRRALRWTGIGAHIVRSIEVQFDGEVGERSGSYKGGCIGCGYEMQRGEDPLQTLRRMERDRSF